MIFPELPEIPSCCTDCAMELLPNCAEPRVRLLGNAPCGPEMHHSEQHRLRNNLRSTMPVGGADDGAADKEQEQLEWTTSLRTPEP